jgi:fluoroquinolone transport system ATP-binding protein
MFSLARLNFDVQDGEIFGFLGPNGSGKSTTQKVLTRILTHYAGHVVVFGREVRSLDAAFYNQIGVSFEFPNLYEKLTAEENLGFYRDFFDVSTEDPRRLLELFDLPVGDSRRVGEFSKGMKMRLVLARSLINRPKLWFLDEPTSGQDPQHAAQIRQLIREQANSGVSVFLTTHDMTLADTLCDRVGFISEGSLVVIDSPRRLKLQHHTRVVRLEYVTADGVTREEFRLDDLASKRAFVDAVLARPVDTIHTLEPSLEDVFLKVTGRGLS